MKLFFTDQQKHFIHHLEDLKRHPVMHFEKHTLKEMVDVADVGDAKKWDQLNFDFFFDYRIFPDYIMTSLGQWHVEKRPMQTGDTLLQQINLPPLKSLSQKIIFGVRINSVVHEPLWKGFSYETLEGHVEKGESSFTLEKQDGRILFRIRTFSEPSAWVTKITKPLFAGPYQRFCTKKALRQVAARMISSG